jgi:hypothetical protein
MPEQIIEIISRDGKRRRARKGEVLADGERFVIPMTFMDAQIRDALVEKFCRDTIRVVDSCGLPAGHRPGFLFDRDHDHVLADAASEAYEERSRRMETAWQRKGEQQDADHHKDRQDPVHDHASRQRTLDELQQAAAQAWEDRKIRMSNAWRLR